MELKGKQWLTRRPSLEVLKVDKRGKILFVLQTFFEHVRVHVLQITHLHVCASLYQKRARHLLFGVLSSLFFFLFLCNAFHLCTSSNSPCICLWLYIFFLCPAFLLSCSAASTSAVLRIINMACVPSCGEGRPHQHVAHSQSEYPIALSLVHFCAENIYTCASHMSACAWLFTLPGSS